MEDYILKILSQELNNELKTLDHRIKNIKDNLNKIFDHKILSSIDYAFHICMYMIWICFIDKINDKIYEKMEFAQKFNSFCIYESYIIIGKYACGKTYFYLNSHPPLDSIIRVNINVDIKIFYEWFLSIRDEHLLDIKIAKPLFKCEPHFFFREYVINYDFRILHALLYKSIVNMEHYLKYENFSMEECEHHMDIASNIIKMYQILNHTLYPPKYKEYITEILHEWYERIKMLYNKMSEIFTTPLFHEKYYLPKIYSNIVQIM